MAREHSVDMDEAQPGNSPQGSPAIVRRGRGFKSQNQGLNTASQKYDSIEMNPAQLDAQPSVEGWVIVIANIHPEAMEEDLRDQFSDYGPIKSLNQILDRQTGYCKGYALLEYATYDEAKRAIDSADDISIMGQKVQVDFAFKRPPPDAGEPVRIDPIVRDRKRPTTIDDRLGDRFDRRRGEDDELEEGEVDESRNGRSFRGRRHHRQSYRKPYSRPQRRNHPDDPDRSERTLERGRDNDRDRSSYNNRPRRNYRSLSPKRK